MTESEAAGSTVFTVLIEEETLEPAPQKEPAPGEVVEQSWFRKKVLKSKPLDLGEAQAQLDRVQGEVDDLIGRLATQSKQGFGLSEVQVAVGVSAQGSIGVVTAGVQASLTLVYSRSGK
ncbi:MAG: hypothetical protein ACLP52_27790 [Streptosporangiaceae bacterium]